MFTPTRLGAARVFLRWMLLCLTFSMSMGLLRAVAVRAATAAAPFRPDQISSTGNGSSKVELAAASRAAPLPDRDGPQKLSARNRRLAFEKVWREIRDRYYDPAFNGVNWNEVHARYLPLVEAARSDAEFYALMSQMTGELHDAHTRFSSPEHWRNYKKQRGTTVGFTVDHVDGKTVVTEVEPGSNAAHAGIEPGMLVLRVDGEPIDNRIEHIQRFELPSSSDRATRWFTYSQLFSGPANSAVRVELQRADGSRFEADILRQLYSESSSVVAYALPSGNAYIRFDAFQPSVVKEFKEALRKDRDAPGVIIDLRRNGGGELSALLPIAGFFFNKKTLFAKDTTRSGKPLSQFGGLLKLPLRLYVGKSGEQIYSGPVAILIDAHSASSSEVFAAGMQETHRARIFGTQSCGCVLGIAKPRPVKGGGVLEISEVLWFTPSGRKLEGSGIFPDTTAAPTVLDLQRKRDAVLAVADQTLTRAVLADARP